MKLPTILIATGIYPPQIGGPATYSKLLFDRLPTFGYAVKVLSFDEVRRFPKIFRHFLYFFKLVGRGRGVDIVYAQDPVSVGLPSLIYAKIFRKKFIIRVAGDYAWEQSCQRFGVKENIDDFQEKEYGFRTEILRKIQKYVVKKSDKAITPSKYFKRLVEKWCDSPEKVVSIYNGINLNIKKLSKIEGRNILGLNPNDKIIISAGRLVPWKGFDTLVEVCKNLRDEKYNNLKLVILGDGPEKDNLLRTICKNGMEDSVIMPGSVSREKMFAYLFSSDVFVLNTSFESFSFQVVEAMNCGLPVVSTKTGNLDEIVDDGINGFLITPDDEKALREKLVSIFENKELRDKISKKAEIKSLDFSVENTINNLIKGLKEVKPH